MSFWQRTSSSSLMSCCVDELIFFGDRKFARISLPAPCAALTATSSACLKWVDFMSKVSRAEGRSTLFSDGTERSALQRIQRRYHLLPFCLPFGEPFLVLFQNVRRDFLHEVRIVELQFRLLDLGIDFRKLLFQARLLGFDISEPFQREKQFAQSGVRGRRALLRRVVRIHFQRLGVEQQFDAIRFLRWQRLLHFEDEPYLLVRRNLELRPQ